MSCADPGPFPVSTVCLSELCLCWLLLGLLSGIFECPWVGRRRHQVGKGTGPASWIFSVWSRLPGNLGALGRSSYSVCIFLGGRWPHHTCLSQLGLGALLGSLWEGLEPTTSPAALCLVLPPCWLCSYLTLLRSVSPSSKVGHLSSLQLESCPALSCSGDASGEFCPAWLPYAGPVYNLTSHTARREEVGPVQSSRIVTAVCPFLKSHLLLWGRASNNGVRERRQATPSSWIVIVHWPVCPALFRM